MTPLGKHLAALIRAGGPIPVSRYMAEALGNPKHGYYMTRDPLGRDGDFITAPEISQIFGELIGLWWASVWVEMGRPDPVRVVELGPGRGTLMADALRAAVALPDFAKAIELHLVEISPVLKALQKEQLRAVWHERLDDVPEGPMLLVANEFFDALPIRQYVRVEDGWRERMVGLDGDNLAFGLAPGRAPAVELLPETAPGDIAEICPAAIAIARAIGERVASHGGAALIVDYGHAQSAPGDTLQALAGHRYRDVFEAPGQADLTAHVDFEVLAQSARHAGAAVHGPVDQGDFLSRLGIGRRAQALLLRATDAQAEQIKSGVRRLAAPDQMGRLFKAMAITDPGLPVPEGF